MPPPSSPEEGIPYLALVILKVAEPAGLKLAYRQPPPALVIAIVPGATSKRDFVRAAAAQAAGAVKAPDHILQMPRGTGAGGRPLEALVTSTAKHVQIVWSIAASPPSGFGNGSTAGPFSDKESIGAPTSFQAITSLADLTDAQFHDCVRKLKAREANQSRGQEDYFVMEVQYSYEEQKSQPQSEQKYLMDDEDFLPLPPIAMSTTRENFYSPEKKKGQRLAVPELPRSQQYEEDYDLPPGLLIRAPPLPAAGGSHGRGLPRSRTQRLPTVEEEPEDGEENRVQRTPRASEKGKGKGKQLDARPLPLPKTPFNSPQRRGPIIPPNAAKALKPDDDRPETYTPDVWGINKTIIDKRIAAHEQPLRSIIDEFTDDDEVTDVRRAPRRAGKKSRIPILPSFNISSPRGFGLKKSASSPSLSEEYKKKLMASSFSQSLSSQQENHPRPEN
ncbi:hypothetical protein PG996_004442 [Apiospora saccharicola]|uniref:Uncharacterized protein n=1 Tax=Apiospora saccharicola TaxID=335842 RepID=A0ABR1W470_9PEZI